ncbi:MAG: lipid hydroperoxide peroxidase [Methylophaga sp.]|nr:MAG: lipid hydroperoxide peroxidase [Methylophaga sp.]
MANLTFKQTPIKTIGRFPSIGEQAPDFKLINTDLATFHLSDLRGKRIIFNVFPSIDTPVCAVQLQKFSHYMADHKNTVLLFASLDLPFAFKRFCLSEGIENTVTASDYRYRTLADNYGVTMQGGPLSGLYARAVFIINEDHKIVYTELVQEVTDEPNYGAVISALAS